jgi:hypothetical protein
MEEKPAGEETVLHEEALALDHDREKAVDAGMVIVLSEPLALMSAVTLAGATRIKSAVSQKITGGPASGVM